MPSEPRRKPSAAKRFLGAAWYVLVCSLFLSVGTIAGWAFSNPTFGEIVKVTLGLKSGEPKTVFNAQQMTVLILGCDEDRYYGGKQILKDKARSDMMLLARFDFEKNRVGGVSIPRDLMVSYPGYETCKANAFHAMGGPELSKQAIEYLLGVTIDRVMVLDYNAFQDMIDIVGGIDVYVPKKMDYDDHRGGLHIHLKQGRQHLDGYEAMGFIRFRKTDSDFNRIERQRDLMLSFKSAVMGNPAVLPAVVEKASQVLGGAFTPEEVSALSLFMRRVKSDNIKMGTLPVTEGRGTYLVLQVDKVEETLQTYYLKPKIGTEATLSVGSNQ